MKVTATIVFIYGLLIGLGGFMGYIKGGSQISFFLGIAFGIPLLVCSYLILKAQILAQYIALVLTFCLDAIFTYRFAKTLHFFPSGLLSLLSLAVLIVIALKISRTRKA